MTQRRKRPRRAAIAGGCLLAGALQAASASAQTLTDPNLSVSTVVNGSLATPTAMAFVGPDDFLVLQKSGSVRRVKNGVLQAMPALTVTVNTLSERGLLGIAVNGETPRKVFLYYTEALVQDGAPLGNRVYRYTWNAASGLLERPQLILDLPTSDGPNHNGGTLLLGPAGEAPGVGDGALLYVVIGDLNRNGQLQNNAAGQPDDTGVILRVRRDGSAAPGNPFSPYCAGATSQTCASDGACGGSGPCVLQVAKYYAYGVRNCFGLALDPHERTAVGHRERTEQLRRVTSSHPGSTAAGTSSWVRTRSIRRGSPTCGTCPARARPYSDPEFSWFATIAPTALALPVGAVSAAHTTAS
jgi:glucose/arabinose dehydrogenase